MEKSIDRYQGPPTTIHDYLWEFLVECPKCGNAALVRREKSRHPAKGKLVCTNCKHVETASSRVRHRLGVKRYCDECGKRMEVTIDRREKPETITVPCPHCGTVRTYKPSFEAYTAKYRSRGKISDPIFNLPLWFQSEVRANAIWAYNRAHLTEIKSYVLAKLRERKSKDYTTMVEKLPQFITAARNRIALLKAIEKMEHK